MEKIRLRKMSKECNIFATKGLSKKEAVAVSVKIVTALKARGITPKIKIDVWTHATYISIRYFDKMKTGNEILYFILNVGYPTERIKK